MQVDAEERGFQLGDLPLYVALGIDHHAMGDVDDLDVESFLLEIIGDGRESHRIHLENRRGGYEVARRPEHELVAAEGVDTRRMQQYEVGGEEGDVGDLTRSLCVSLLATRGTS